MKSPTINSKEPVIPNPSKKFYLLMEYGMGGEIDHANMGFAAGCEHNRGWYDYDTTHVDLSKNLGLCNGFRIWNDPTPERIAHAMAGGYAAMLELWPNAGRWKLWAEKRGKSTQEYLDAMVDHVRKLVMENPDSVWVNMFAENDNSPWSDMEIPGTTRPEIFAALRNFFDKTDFRAIEARQVAGGLGTAADPLGGLSLAPYDYLRSRAISPASLNMVNLCCQLFSPHLLYSLGAEGVWPQGGVGRNHQVTIAFTRGAARQYGKPWFYDMAPFDCQGSEIPLAYDDHRRRFSGFSEDFMLRTWMLSFLAGPKAFLFQAAEMGFFIKDADGKRSLSPLGEIARDFADFTLREHPERGEAVTPVALLLPRDHGYSTCFHNSAMIFWKKLPNDRPNNEIEAFFRLAFPGCHETHGFSFDANRWAPGGSWEEQRSWMKKNVADRQEYARNFHEAVRDGLDQRPFEQGFITPSTWGDSFDVLVDDASEEVLAKYKGVIALGGVKLDGELSQKLKTYVANGGKLMLNSSGVSPKDAEFLGVEFKPGMGKSYYHSHSALTGRKFDEGFYQYAKIAIAGAKALLYADAPWDKSKPIVTRNPVGKGEVWFTAVPQNQAIDKYDLSLCESSKEAFDEFIRPLLEVEIKGAPIHWTLNRLENGFLLGLFNNTGNNWEGKVTLNHDLEVESVRDTWNDKPARYAYDETGRAVLSSCVAPWEFKIIEIKERKSF